MCTATLYGFVKRLFRVIILYTNTMTDYIAKQYRKTNLL